MMDPRERKWKDDGMEEVFGPWKPPTLQEETEARAAQLESPFGRRPASAYGWSDDEDDPSRDEKTEEEARRQERRRGGQSTPTRPQGDAGATARGERRWHRG